MKTFSTCRYYTICYSQLRIKSFILLCFIIYIVTDHKFQKGLNNVQSTVARFINEISGHLHTHEHILKNNVYSIIQVKILSFLI